MTNENQQNSTKFTPSPEQLAFADMYLLQEGNVTKAFNELERDRTVYYTVWRKQQGFQEWLSEYCRTEVLKRSGQWFVWAEKHARNGSYKHMEMLMNIAKEFTPAPLVSFPQITYVINGNIKEYEAGRFPKGVVHTESGGRLDDTGDTQ